MQIDILNGAATLDIGNPNKGKHRIVQYAVMNPNETNAFMTIYAHRFGQFVAGMDGVSVNDTDSAEANLVWQLWDACDSSTDYKRLFDRFLELHEVTIDELTNALQQASNSYFQAPPELQTDDVEALDPN